MYVSDPLRQFTKQYCSKLYLKQMFQIHAPKFLQDRSLRDNDYFLICNYIFAQLLTHNRCSKQLLYTNWLFSKQK